MKLNLNNNKLPSKIFVTGIGTGIGKTMVCAELCKSMGYDYWKPVQSGDLDNPDSKAVAGYSTETKIHSETYKLLNPMSPHASAEIDGVKIELTSFELPEANKLCVEGAGGLMVPLNDKETMFDLIEKLELEVVLVVRDYLGCINHTLLSLEVLKIKNIKIAAVIFNGIFTPSTLSYLENYILPIPAIYMEAVGQI